MHNTWLIIRREYLERIRSKAFIIMTMLMPVFMASTILIPALLSGMKSGGTRRIVLVVNNPEVAEVTVTMLQQLGFKVCAVGDAAAALEMIEQQPFPLVVSDVVMAGSMDGRTLARTIRERQPTLPVLLVTGYSNVVGEAGGGVNDHGGMEAGRRAGHADLRARSVADGRRPRRRS